MATRTATLPAKAKKERKPSPAWWRWTKRVFWAFVILFLIGSSYIGLKFMSAYHQAQDMVGSLQDKILELDSTPSRIVSADGVVLYQITDVYRKPLGDYNKIPANMRNAIIAAEDKRFFEHSGVDPWGIARAVFGMARGTSHTSGGGSTITMQLAKLMYSHSEQTFDRKMQDIALAIAIEQRYSKEQILTMYLDKAYFGSGAYGVQAAAEIYFGKPLDELDTSECATLARCVRRPSDENPYKNFDKSIENRDVVLGVMREMGTLSEQQYDHAIKEKIHLRQKTAPQLTVDLQHAPYFVQHVLEELHDKYNIDLEDLKQGTYTIRTTLNYNLQKVAETQVHKTVREFRGMGVTTAAFMVMDKDGQIKAEVGGMDYHKSTFNHITHGARQPGSSFKPFVYSAALTEGKIDIFGDVSNELTTYHNGGRPWTPRNDNGRYGGSVSVRSAIMYSMNVPAAHVMDLVGPDTAVQYAHGAFGFTTQLQPFMSLVLGAQPVHPIEMAQAYSVFMLRGSRATPYTITEIDTPDGEAPTKVNPVIVPNVLGADVSDDIDALLRAVVMPGGTGQRAREVPNARGKTGTTQENKDAWFCGYTDGLIGIGWVANCRLDEKGMEHYSAMNHSAFGGTVTVPLWVGVMSYAHDHFATPMAERPLALSFGEHGAGIVSSHGPDANPNGDPALVPDDHGQGGNGPSPGDYPDDPGKYPDSIPPPSDNPQPPGDSPPPVLQIRRPLDFSTRTRSGQFSSVRRTRNRTP